MTDLHIRTKDGAGLTTELQREVLAFTSVLKDLVAKVTPLSPTLASRTSLSWAVFFPSTQQLCKMPNVVRSSPGFAQRTP